MNSRLIAAALLWLACGAALAGDYTLSIDGKPYDFELGRLQVIKLADGRSLTVSLNRKDVVTYTGAMFSFDHVSKLSPARKDLKHGVRQTMMISPLGTLILVQEYSSLDPTDLVDTMLNELTKEEAHYGYKITKSDVRRTLPGGTTLSGKAAASSYKDSEIIRQVFTSKSHDAGVLIITQIDKDAPPEDQQMLDLFWKSLSIAAK